MKAFTLIALGLAIAAMGIDVADADDSAPSPQYAAAVERARELVRSAVLEQNLPGMSMAVGARSTVVWAEGFGWNKSSLALRVGDAFAEQTR